MNINQNHRHSQSGCRIPIPAVAVYILVSVFIVGLCVSTFFLIVVHNAVFFIVHLSITTLVAAFLFWNSRNAAVLFFLHSFPDSDLALATHGQLVKITGVVSCGNVCLESSYERVGQCVYTSTLLYEHRDLCFKPPNVRDLWRLLAYSERLSTDFYITELKSGIRALVKAGGGSQVIPLINENKLIQTTRVVSSDFRKWLRDRNLSDEARILCLEEGYINEGMCISVVGVLQKNKDDVVMIVEPQEIITTGCLWSKLLLPVDVKGLIIGVPAPDTTANMVDLTNQ